MAGTVDYKATSQESHAGTGDTVAQGLAQEIQRVQVPTLTAENWYPEATHDFELQSFTYLGYFEANVSKLRVLCL